MQNRTHTMISCSLCLGLVLGIAPGLVSQSLSEVPVKGYIPVSLNEPTLEGANLFNLVAANLREPPLYFKPPRRGAPTTSRGGASRGGCTESAKNMIVPLIPLSPKQSSTLTLSAYPTFFFFVPANFRQKLKFSLKDDSEQLIYRQELQVNSEKDGIIQLELPAATAKPLEVNHSYDWTLRIACNPNNASDDIKIEGTIQRIEANSTLSRQLIKTSNQNLPALYADAGIWHETVVTLVQLRRSTPNNSRLAIQWAELLRSVGLDETIAQAPLINCCTLQE